MPRKTTLAEKEEGDSERTVEFEPPPDGAMPAEGGEEPVVWPKVVTVCAASPELSAPHFVFFFLC